MAGEQRVIVLGGGVIGVTSAYHLALRGCRVTVIERLPEVGLETSFANGGLFTPSMADPWAAPGVPLKLLKWLGREDAPFLLRLHALPGLLSWGLKFLGNCTEARWRRNTEIILRLAEYSLAEHRRLVEQTGLAFDRSRLGTLRLFRDELSMANAERGAALVGDLGLAVRTLSPADCAELEPALTPELQAISGGIHFPDDESGDAFLYTRGLAGACRGLPVTFRCGVTVTGLDTDGDRVTAVRTDKGLLQADQVLVALGNAAPALLRDLRIALPIYPVKGYSVTLSTEGWNGAPKVPLIDDGLKMGVTRLGDRLRLAGTAEFTGPDKSLNPRRCGRLVDNLQALFPSFPNRDSAEHWAGLRPMTPDGVPLLGATRLKNLYVNAGHGHLGWTLSCGSAAAVADLMTGRKPEIDLAPLSPGRS